MTVAPRSPAKKNAQKSSLTLSTFNTAQNQLTPTRVLRSCNSTRCGGCRFVYSACQWLCRQPVSSRHVSKGFPLQVHSQGETERDLQMVLHLHRRRNNSAAGDKTACNYSGIPKLYVRVAYPASQVPKKSLSRQKPHTSLAEVRAG